MSPPKRYFPGGDAADHIDKLRKRLGGFPRSALVHGFEVEGLQVLCRAGNETTPNKNFPDWWEWRWNKPAGSSDAERTHIDFILLHGQKSKQAEERFFLIPKAEFLQEARKFPAMLKRVELPCDPESNPRNYGPFLLQFELKPHQLKDWVSSITTWKK